MREIREVAKKLAMSFGINLQPIRKPLIALHQSVHTSEQCLDLHVHIGS